MADKDYNVKLQLQIGDSITNIDQLLRKVTDLKGAISDMEDTQLAFNVVIRNAGFQNAIANLNKHLMKLAEDGVKAGTKAGEGIEQGIEKSADKLKRSNPYQKVAKSIAKDLQAEVEGSLKGLSKALDGITEKIREGLEKSFSSANAKGLEELVATSVSKGMLKATQRFSTVGMNNFNAQTDNFKDIIDSFKHYSNDMEKFAEEMTDLFEKLKEMMGKFTTNSIDIIRSVAKEEARTRIETQWSEDHISKRDKLAAEAEQRRLDLEEQRVEIEKAKEAHRQAREEIKLENDERRESIRLEKELNREERKAKADIAASNAAEAKYRAEAEKLAREEAAAEERRARVKERSLKQERWLEASANKEAQRDKLYETELEKALYNYEVATNRILSQRQATIDHQRVSESAIANAAKQKRDAEIQAAQALYKQIVGYDRIKERSEATVEATRKLATNLQRLSSAISSISSMFTTIRGVATSFASMIKSAGSTFLGYARQGATTLANSALDQYKELQTAQIGFENFFGKNIAKDLISQIREEAMKAPGVDAGDLAAYVRQIAPVSNHDSQLALDAALGMIKTVQYGGAEASEEMEYVIKNIRDVIAKGTATAIDLRQFNRAMPILEEVLGQIGASDFIKNGTLKIDKNNAKDLLNAFADINNNPESPVRDIFSQMQHTLAGITDIIKQTFVTRFNETLEGFGFYDKVQTILEDFYNSGYIEKFYNALANLANRILEIAQTVNWEQIANSVASGFRSIWQAVKDVAAMFMDTLGATDVNGVIKKLMDLIANFIRGFGEGFNKILEIVSWAEEHLGSDILNKAASFLGAIASPLGKVIQVIFSILQNMSNFGSRAFYLKAENFRAASKSILQDITTASGEAIKEVSMRAATENPVIRELAQTAGTIYNKGASIEKKNVAMYNPQLGTLAKLKEDGSWDTMGGLNNLTSKELDKILKQNGLQTTKMANAQAWLSKKAVQLRDMLGKAVKSFAMYEVGSALSSVAGEIAASATGNKDIKGVVTGLGNAASAAIAVGTQFGLLPGAIAGAVSALKTLYDASKKLSEMQHELTQTLKDQLSNTVYTNLLTSLIAQLSDAGLYTTGNLADESAKAAMYDKLKEGLKKGQDLDELVEEARQTYIDTRAQKHAREMYSAWAKAYDGKNVSYTTLDPNANYDKVRELYDKLVQLGFVASTNTTRYDSEGNNVEYTGEEIMNYLSTKDWNVKSVEGLNALLSELDSLINQVKQENEVDFKFKALYVYGEGDGSTEYDSFAAMADANGWLLHDGVWTSEGQLKIYLKAADEESKNFLNVLQELFFGTGTKDVQASLGGRGWANGGKIKPIYRASGGDTRGVDTVPAMLQPGEFVMRKSAVGKVGTGVLSALNVGDLGKAAQLLGAKVSNSWNNARSYIQNANRTYKTVNNRVVINNRTNGGRVSSYNNLANRLAAGF